MGECSPMESVLVRDPLDLESTRFDLGVLIVLHAIGGKRMNLEPSGGISRRLVENVRSSV